MSFTGSTPLTFELYHIAKPTGDLGGGAFQFCRAHAVQRVAERTKTPLRRVRVVGWYVYRLGGWCVLCGVGDGDGLGGLRRSRAGGYRGYCRESSDGGGEGFAVFVEIPRFDRSLLVTSEVIRERVVYSVVVKPRGEEVPQGVKADHRSRLVAPAVSRRVCRGLNPRRAEYGFMRFVSMDGSRLR